MNVDGARACVDKAKDAIRENNHARAIRLLERSLRLHELPEATSLLRRLQQKPAAAQPASQPAGRSQETSTPRAAASSGSGSGKGATDDGTMRRILGANDLYQVLDVPRSASGGVIKKAYRKLALKYHPDKNQAPGAEDVFKKIGHAFTILSDAEKKNIYDQTGDDGQASSQPQPGRGGGGMPRGGMYYQEELSPEDIFNMMFNGFHPGMQGGPRMRTRRVYRAGGGFGGDHRQGGGGEGETRDPSAVRMTQLLQLLPVLLMFFFFLTSLSSEPDLTFNLNRSSSYRVPRRTAVAGIVPNLEYYVKPDFWSNLKNDKRKLAAVEREVEQTTHRHLRRQCNRERQQQLQLKYRARRQSGARATALLSEAERMPKPNCDSMEKHFGHSG